MLPPLSATVKPAALILSPEPPYPLHGGGPQRTASLLNYLARYYTVDLILFRQPGAPDPTLAIPPGLVRSTRILKLPYHRNDVASRVLRNSLRMMRGTPPLVDRFSGFETFLAQELSQARYQIGIVEHFWCAPYAAVLNQICDRLVLDLHNIESALHASCAAAEPWIAALGHRRFGPASLRLEREWLPRYGRILTTSQADADRVHSISPTSLVTVYPNSTPWVPRPQREPSHSLAFSGNLRYHPNQSAFRYFRDSIWPLLRDRFPNLRWRIIGKNPEGVEPLVRGDSRIELVGPVPDAVSELARSEVVVAPLISGSGTRVKIIEAWAAGRAVVATTIAAEGLSTAHGENFLLADTAADFAHQIARLLEDSVLRSRIADGGRRKFEDEYTWEAAWRALGTTMLPSQL